MRLILRLALLITVAAFAMPSSLSADEPKLPPDLKNVAVAEGVELHYVEKGKGVPIIFIHGGGGDCTVLAPGLGPFAEQSHCRAIAYSCRYNYPNTNKVQPNYSQIVAAEDLAGLIKKLDLGKVHVSGYSLGGQTALFLALKHPELVRTLTLLDPGVHLKGYKLPEDFVRRITAARAAFEQGKTEEALELIMEGPAGRKVKFDQFPEPFQKKLLRNAGELEALVKGEFIAECDPDAVKKLEVPVLLMFGEKSPPHFKLIEEQLTRALPEKNRKLVIVKGGDHGFVATHGKEVQKEILDFLKDK